MEDIVSAGIAGMEKKVRLLKGRNSFLTEVTRGL